MLGYLFAAILLTLIWMLVLALSLPWWVAGMPTGIALLGVGAIVFVNRQKAKAAAQGLEDALSAQGAAQVGLAMPPTVVLIYGNPKGGTPLMLAAPYAALDLPLRVLARAAETGTSVSFHPIAPTLLRAGVPDHLAHALDPAQRLIEEALQP